MCEQASTWLCVHGAAQHKFLSMTELSSSISRPSSHHHPFTTTVPQNISVRAQQSTCAALNSPCSTKSIADETVEVIIPD